RNFQVLELPYKDNDLSMVILLPTTLEGLRNHEKQLSWENFELWSTKAKETTVNVWVPKFKVTSEFSLKQSLGKMGMKSVFSNADFSAMTDKTDGLYLSDVVHKAFVDVNEQGTEAGAATGVIGATKGGPAPVIPDFKADRPFFFMIKANRSDAILFVGRVM